MIRLNSNTFEGVLVPANWAQNGSKWDYTITNELITVDAILDLVINGNSQELVDSISTSMISGFSQQQGSLTIYAWAAAPTIEIPYSLIMRGGI